MYISSCVAGCRVVLCSFLLFHYSRSHIYLWYYMAKRKQTLKKIVEQPKPIVDEVPEPAPVPVTEKKSGPMSLFECMKRRRDKE